MRIEHLYRYPVKGLSAESLEEITLAEGEVIPHDRRFALAQGDASFDESAPRFLPKQNFACLMANARVALLHSAFDSRSGLLVIRGPQGGAAGEGRLAASTHSAEGRAAIADFITRFLGAEARGQLRFVEAPGHAFTDQKRKGISLINLASLRALEQAIGRQLDPLRFRANIYFSGLPAWAEFGWLGQEVLLGGARLEIFKRTVRCPATQVDLETGERDCDVPRLLREHFGHADLGVHAAVLEGGRVAVGDSLEPV
ncbi:Xylene monooxygenase electron transfer component [Roseomonas mucosa]|uniref:MOSC domain-containing protein n=1 Tax=Roseomonas mucosa TaxID=207340 RepID=A0A1S8D2B4_9PROT|nr:MOSC domain-containing protein [Roseomonas mucosa]AWV22923.1 Xylene monooxygenase electron transfer component [Roseomonas mucosa]MDT8274724.1 MOSC domain-containing protein [Roseomonas mucosa]MDT8354035.1 MOSC domain-containing protein [Roseomonas mucosa]MDU7523943.1 MOSC domain-containing protein [Roseomonas mucosa]ONH82361.1 MOSC domain-containing protein [Roseomonas mucosa]